MEWICYITAIVFVFDFDDCTFHTGVRQGWQWQVGAVSITMCWLNLVIFIADTISKSLPSLN